MVADNENWVEIFRAGSQTASDGRNFYFSIEDLDQIVDSYSPTKFKAPLILSHNTFGRTDRELAESELAFGMVKKLKRDGKSLKAYCDPVAPEVREWQEQGKILDRSASFYPPNSPNNPNPGKWALRHVALLGKTPPAVKGMENLNLSEILDFSEEDSLEFGDRYKCSIIHQLFSGIRDFLIESHGLEKANQLIPSDYLYSLKNDNDDESSRIFELMQRLEERITSLEDKQPITMFREDNFVSSELQQEIEQLREELKRQKRERRRDRIASFVEKNVSRLTPAMLEKVDIQFGEDIISEDFAGFCEGLSDSQLNYFEKFVSQIPSRVEFSEITAGGSSRRLDYQSDGSSQSKLLAAIAAYQSEHPEMSFQQIQNLPEFAEQVNQIYQRSF